MNIGTQAPTQLRGYDVYDPQGNKVGSVEAVWVDANNTGTLEFVGVKTGLLGDAHVVPASDLQVDSSNNSIQVPYSQDTVKNAPTCNSNDTMTQDQEQQIYSYYQSAGAAQQPASRPAPSPAATMASNVAAANTAAATNAAAVPGTTVAEQRSAAPGDFPVDDLTYDLLTLLQEKLQALEVYDHYLEDAEGDDTVGTFLRSLRDQDAQAAVQLRQMVGRRLSM